MGHRSGPRNLNCRIQTPLDQLSNSAYEGDLNLVCVQGHRFVGVSVVLRKVNEFVTQCRIECVRSVNDLQHRLPQGLLDEPFKL